MVEEPKLSIIETKNKNGNEVRVILTQPETAEEIEEAAKVLTLIFITDNPTFLYRKATYEKTYPLMHNGILNESIPIKACYILKDTKSQKIIGVCCARDFSSQYNIENLAKHEQTYISNNMPRYVVKLWKKYRVIFENNYSHELTRILRIRFIGITKEFQGLGLGSILLQAALERGKEMGYELATYDAANLMSKLLAEKNGFVSECSIQYEDYSMEVIEDGEKVVKYPLKGINEFITKFIEEQTGRLIVDPAKEVVLMTKKLII